jgi:hypothetical protein
MTGIQAVAVARAATAMMHALGGETVILLFASLALPGDTASQLGLVDPGVDEVAFAPVITRSMPTDSIGPRRRVEFLLPASAVNDELAARGFSSGDAMLEAALGIVYQNQIFHIEGFVSEEFAGTPYMYRISAVD